jgi:hypothetical protein
MHTLALLLTDPHLLYRRFNILVPLLFLPFFPLPEEVSLQNGEAA